MADKRIYLVVAHTSGTPTHYLVRTTHPNRAIAHVVDKLGVTASVASQEELLDAFVSGLKVEDHP